MAETNFEYFDSSDIKIYPTARRGTFKASGNTFTYDPEARLNTEYNTTNGFSKTPERQSYVVRYISNDDILKCVIGGYYFEIKNFNTKYLINKPQYLIISTTTVSLINTTTDARTTQLLMSLAENSTETTVLDNEQGKFTGLAYTNKANVAINYTYLQLFQDDNCTKLNQEAYLITSLVKSGAGNHSIVGTFGFENSDEILDPNNTSNTNIGSGDYSITLGNNNENNGNYSLVYGNKIVNNGNNSIIITANSTEKTITGDNNILIGEDIKATGHQLILNKIEKVTICNGNKNVLDYSAENGFSLGENLVTISKTNGLVLTTEDANYINLIKVDTGDHTPFRLTLDKNKNAELVIGGSISVNNMELFGTLSKVTQITMANGGTIDNSSGNISAGDISATQSHLGNADARILTVTNDAQVHGVFSSCSVVTNSASVSGAATVESLIISQTATGRGISFGNNAQIRYDATNKRLEIIC